MKFISNNLNRWRGGDVEWRRRDKDRDTGMRNLVWGNVTRWDGPGWDGQSGRLMLSLNMKMKEFGIFLRS